MTTLVPRPPYSEDELRSLYPQGLELQLVQVLLRHGERTPVRPRFQNAGLTPYWPYCTAAQKMASVTATGVDTSSWSNLQWCRHFETFGQDDEPVSIKPANSETGGICDFGELTDKGRETTLNLGKRLRHLYVDQLGFMPNNISNTDSMYLRASPMPRALESLQQAFTGMYPPSARSADFALPSIVTRTRNDETLFPSTLCKRFKQLSEAYSKRAAERWDDSSEMEYINKLISKWMTPESPKVKVNSHPQLVGVMDSINATDAHGPATKLPKEFYDPKLRKALDTIAVEEWFGGYKESNEYRTVGIGALVGDLVSRMIWCVRNNEKETATERPKGQAKTRGDENQIKFSMSGCHDTTIAATLASFGAFDDEPWPRFTSHVALELFKKKKSPEVQPSSGSGSSLWSSIFNVFGSSKTSPEGVTRQTLDEMSKEDRDSLDGYFVRIRYNDRPVTVPGCKIPGNHLEGDETFCTLEAFKKVADRFTPKDWRKSCISNLGKPAFPSPIEKPGY